MTGMMAISADLISMFEKSESLRVAGEESLLPWSSSSSPKCWKTELA